MENKKENTSSYSARFTPTQRKVIEQAAKLKGMTAARFMRDAAYKNAAYILNSQGKQKNSLKRIASVFADAVVNPKVEVFCEDSDCHPSNKERYETKVVSYEDSEARDEGKDQPWVRDSVLITNAKPMRLGLEEIEQIKTALLNSGPEFITYLLDELNINKKIRYSPVIDLASSSENPDDVDQDDEDVE